MGLENIFRGEYFTSEVVTIPKDEFPNWKLFPSIWNILALTLFPSGPGHYGPYYHKSVCCYPMVGGRFPKIHDFVPFAICQDLEKLLLTFFTKKFEKLAIKNFQGSSSIR